MLELTEVLRGGRQCDEDGVEIIMSREACHVAANEIDQLRAQLAEFQVVAYRREWSGDESDIGDWIYAGVNERDHQGVWEPLYARVPNYK
jgi:hypothetical protein